MNRIWKWTAIMVGLLLTTAACDGDDVFMETEDPLPQDPVVVNVDDGFAELRQNNQTLYKGTGNAVTVQNLIYVISSGDIQCSGGRITGRTGNSDPFYITFLGSPTAGWTLNSAFVGKEVNGQMTLFTTSAQILQACGGARPNITIQTLTDDTIAGTFEAEVFPLQVQKDSTFDCAGNPSIGKVNLSFNLPLRNCQ